jgi:hypothetical protein
VLGLLAEIGDPVAGTGAGGLDAVRHLVRHPVQPGVVDPPAFADDRRRVGAPQGVRAHHVDQRA